MDDDFPESVEDIMGLGPDATDAEKEFFNVMEQLRGMEGMKFVSDVYTKLYDSYFEMKEARDQRQIAIDELTSRADKFDEIIASYQADNVEQNKTIEKLRADVDEARALADAMHARELAAVEALETMKRNVTRLEKELDARKKAGDDDLGAQSAAKEKEKFEKEKARLLTEIDTLKARVVNMQQYQEELDQKNTAAEEKIAKLEETLEEAENQAVRHNRLIEFLKNEKAKIKEEVDARGKTINELNEKNADLVETIEKFEKRVKQLNQELESAKQEQEAAVTKARQFRTSWERCKKDLEQCQATLFHTTKELKHNIAEGQKFQMEIQKKAKEFAAASKKLAQMEARKSELESERDRLREQITVMEREISLRQKQSEEERREIENLNREKEILNKNMQKIQYEAMENLTMLNLQQNQRKQLDHEIDLNNKQLNKQRLMIRQLEKDKDRLLEEAIALNEKIDECMDEVRLRNADIADLKKDIRERSLNTRRLTVTLDATRAERNTLHKNLTEAQDEIQDLKQKLKMLAYQIEQLKEDIAGKETSLKSCESTLQKCYKKNDMLRVEIQSGQAKLSEARAEIAALKQEEARLHRIVQEGDAQRNKLLKELEGLMNERDVVGAQLVRRNDEITLLYEKIRILEITLHRGERQYEQRVEDIRLLRLEIIRLRKEKNLLSKGIENMTDLRLEVFNLERELGRERLRVRALEEALETPLNVHRWRKLQGTDPHSVHLTQKLRLTQKKVLVQSEMLVLKDRELKETRNLYGAVKDMLALQPSPEIQQTLNQTQRALAARTSKMKCMVAELSMRERQLCDLRLELKRTSEDLTSFKQKYYELKRALDADEARRLRIPTPKDKEYPPCVDTCPYNPCPIEPGECEDCPSRAGGTVPANQDCVPTCPYRPSAKTLDKVRPKE